MLDLLTAQRQGICPVCGGYGGRPVPGDYPEYYEYTEHDCEGSCEKCWCPGCHDGWSGPKEMGGEAFGSWEAYDRVRSLSVSDNQGTTDDLLFDSVTPASDYPAIESEKETNNGKA